MKTLLQAAVHLIALTISLMVNVLSIGAMDADLTPDKTVAIAHVNLPSVTVVGRRIPETSTQLAAADTVKPL